MIGFSAAIRGARHELCLALFASVLALLIGRSNPAFFSLANFYDLLRNCSVLGIFTLGVLLVLISGGIDISFTAIAVCSMYICSRILIACGAQGAIYSALLLSGAIGALLGTINAALVTSFRTPALIVTLGTASLYRGFTLAFIGTAVITDLPRGLISFSKIVLFERSAAGGEVYGLSPFILLFAAIAAATAVVLRFSILGRGVYALGGDPVAARRAGYAVNRIQFFVYGYAGFLAGLAGISHATMMRNANPFDLVGTELTVIAAAVLGGASISGGRGTVAGAVLGVFVLVLIQNSLLLLGIPTTWHRVAVGAVIIISTALNARR